MASISEIRDALKSRLDTIAGLHVYDTVPGSVNCPAAVIRRRTGPAPATLGRTRQDYSFTVTVITSLADDRAAQDKLDAFLSGEGADSIVSAIEADSELGGVVEYAELSTIEADQVVEVGTVSYLGADMVFDIGAD